ncbi:MAG: AbrB/MazE/SpoVT family DNA-binding domain-containing protein [Chromatiaceae bacterium]|nr:AbrB/MazE/SpoVT family DNA-binding domain-containing protein [Chromatiaceae bacterium]
MKTGKVKHESNAQLVELPPEAQFPDNVTEVTVRVNGADRILSPTANSWDSFFLQDLPVTDDFMPDLKI